MRPSSVPSILVMMARRAVYLRCMRGATDFDRIAIGDAPDFARGQRVRLSELGIWSIVAWPVRGHLSRGMTRRSCYTRKLTDMSVGTVTTVREHHCVVAFDGIVVRRSIAKRFLRPSE